MEIGRVTKRAKKVKRVLRRCHLERRLCVESQLDCGIMNKINCRREVYKKFVSGRKELWARLCKEVKEAVREKKLSIWNEVVEKVNADFERSRNKFWAFVGKYMNITLLKSKAGVSVNSTQGKLEVLRRYYEALGKVSVDDNFEADSKEEIVSTLETCSNFYQR